MTTRTPLASIEATVENGKAVISGDDSTVVAAVQDAIRNGRTATFYVSRLQYDMVMRWYYTPERIRALGMEPVSKEEQARIEAELGVEETGSMYSNRIRCRCGEEYGAFEFIQQGVREHGIEQVVAVLELKSAAVVRVNPPTFAVCPHCEQRLLQSHNYQWFAYGCCMEVVVA